MSRLIQAHRDEIWDVVRVQVPESYEPTYMYASTYRYNFADGAEWHRIWDEVAAPVVQEAMSDGLLGGWVILSHNTGGSHNFKVLYLFDEWDHIDNFFERVIGTISEQHESDASVFRILLEGGPLVLVQPQPVFPGSVILPHEAGEGARPR